MIIYRWILLRMRNVSDKVGEKIKRRFMFSVFFPKIMPFMRYCLARQATDCNKTRHMRIACWVTVANNPPSDYVILIAFPRQQWLRERACGTYVHACLV